MIALIVFLASVLVACAVAGMAAWSDVRGLTIPNSYSVIIVGSYVFSFSVLYFLAGDADLPTAISSLVAALIFFGVSFAMFSLKMLGAGDSKFGTACAFWVGLSGLPVFLFYMTLTGGFLALLSLVLKKWRPVQNPPEGSWVQVVQDGHSKVPYGVAIFAGMLASFANLGYFKYETFVSLLLG